MSSIKDFELAQRIHIATHELKSRIAALEAERKRVAPLVAKVTRTVDDWNDPRQGNPFQHPLTKLVDAARGKGKT